MPEVRFETPRGWGFVPIEQLLVNSSDNIVDGPFGSKLKASEYVESGVPILRIQNIDRNKFKDNGIQYVTKLKADELKRHSFKAGDIILNKLGEPAGKACIVPKHFESGIIVADIVRIRLDTQVVSREYLTLAINAPLVANQFSKLAKGITRQRVNLSQVRSLKIPVPPVSEQISIVREFNKLMLLCDQLESQTEASIEAHQTLVKSLLETLTNAKDADELKDSWQRISAHFDVLFTTEDSIDQLKQTILQLAVMGKLVKQDPNDEPASKLLERIAEEKEQLIKDKKIKKPKPLPSISESEKPFGIPNSWCWTRLGDIYSFLNGFAFKSHWFCDNGIKLLRNINIGHGETRWIEKVCIPFEMRDEFDNFELAEGDIVISLDRPIINTGLKYAIVNQSDLPCLLLQRVAKFHSIGDRVSTSFLSKWLETDTFISSINPGRSNGVPHISTKQLEMTLFPLIPENEQLEIVRKANEMLSICDSLKFKLASARSNQVKIADAMNG